MIKIYLLALFASGAFSGQNIDDVADQASIDSACTSCLTASRLLSLDCAELESIYKNGSMPNIPDGKLRGTVIVSPGSAANRTVSRTSRVVWQGKVFDQNCGVAVNKFFGIRLIKGQLAAGESWLDGQPALILDYRQTSLLYANVRDEIRQVAPGLFLGAMYEEKCCVRNFKMFFILETQCCSK